MSWWSEAIMGGDSPLDCLDDLAEVCGVEFDPESDEGFHCHLFTRAKLEASMDKIKKSLRKSTDPIYGQVVGATFLWAGAEMPEELKTRVTDDAKKDTWAAEGDVERKRYIDEFIEKVENHKPGERVEI